MREEISFMLSFFCSSVSRHCITLHYHFMSRSGCRSLSLFIQSICLLQKNVNIKLIFFFLLTRSLISSCFLFLTASLQTSQLPSSLIPLPHYISAMLCHKTPISLFTNWQRSHVLPLLGHGSVSKQFSKLSLRLRHYLTCKFESNNGPDDH